MTTSSLSLLLVTLLFLLCVLGQVISTGCPPDSGKSLDVYNNNLTCFIGIYTYCMMETAILMDHIFGMMELESTTLCVLPGSTLTTGQWVRVENNDPVDCTSNSDSDPFRCTTVTSPNATLSLYLPNAPWQFLPEVEDGFYTCCLPTNCSDPNTNKITANIFSKLYSTRSSTHTELLIYTVGWVQIADITVDLPSVVTVLPQQYTLHAIKAGASQHFIRSTTWYYESGSNSTELTSTLCSGQQSGYSCTIGNGVLFIGAVAPIM